MELTFSMLAITALTVAVPTNKTEPSEMTAMANCRYGFSYCGKTLLNVGNYENDIKKALSARGQPTDAAHILYSLFNCDGFLDGSIQFIQYCGTGGCIDAGAGNDDKCTA